MRFAVCDLRALEQHLAEVAALGSATQLAGGAVSSQVHASSGPMRARQQGDESLIQQHPQPRIGLSAMGDGDRVSNFLEWKNISKS